MSHSQSSVDLNSAAVLQALSLQRLRTYMPNVCPGPALWAASASAATHATTVHALVQGAVGSRWVAGWSSSQSSKMGLTVLDC